MALDKLWNRRRFSLPSSEARNTAVSGLGRGIVLNARYRESACHQAGTTASDGKSRCEPSAVVTGVGVPPLAGTRENPVL